MTLFAGSPDPSRPTPTAVAQAEQPIEHDPRMPAPARPVGRSASSIVLAVIGFLALSIVLVIVALYLVTVLGPTALTIALVLAAIPLVIVLLGIRWIDRWEPEPRGALVFAFLWGAAASVLIALVFSGISQYYEAAAGIAQSGASMFFASVIQAPIVEESAKGFGILLLFWVVRRSFDGPVDGLVYGATIAIGFAFTENLQYFGLAILSDQGLGEGVAQTFFLRAVLSPFAHVMFTACTGVALGMAASRTGRLGAIGFYLLGLIPAVLLHGFWNSATYWATNFFEYYVLVQVPLFVIGIIAVVQLRRHEQRITHDRLAEYAAVGWFTPYEVALLSTGAGRRQGSAWAARNGIARPWKTFVQDATHLAFTRHRLIKGRDTAGAQRDEADILAAITADRAALAGR